MVGELILVFDLVWGLSDIGSNPGGSWNIRQRNWEKKQLQRLAHTSIFALCFMSVCLMKSNCYSLICSSLIWAYVYGCCTWKGAKNKEEQIFSCTEKLFIERSETVHYSLSCLSWSDHDWIKSLPPLLYLSIFILEFWI